MGFHTWDTKPGPPLLDYGDPLGVSRRGFSALSTAGTHNYTGNVSLKAFALVRGIGQIVRTAGVGVFISLCGFSGAVGV